MAIQITKQLEVSMMDGKSKLSRYLLMLDRLYQRGDDTLKARTLAAINETIKKVASNKKATGIMDELSYTSVIVSRLDKLYNLDKAVGGKNAA